MARRVVEQEIARLDAISRQRPLTNGEALQLEKLIRTDLAYRRRRAVTAAAPAGGGQGAVIMAAPGDAPASAGPLTADMLAAMVDRPVSPAEAMATLRAIDLWCRRHGVSGCAFGRMAVDFGGFVGLLALRGTLRTRMHAVVHAFLAAHQDGPPADPEAARLAARALLRPLRVPGSSHRPRAARALPGYARPATAPLQPVDRDPCRRCGVRADVGCPHRPRAPHSRPFMPMEN